MCPNDKTSEHLPLLIQNSRLCLRDFCVACLVSAGNRSQPFGPRNHEFDENERMHDSNANRARFKFKWIGKIKCKRSNELWSQRSPICSRHRICSDIYRSGKVTYQTNDNSNNKKFEMLSNKIRIVATPNDSNNGRAAAERVSESTIELQHRRHMILPEWRSERKQRSIHIHT